MTTTLKKYGLRAFAVGVFCALCFLIGQVSTYTTFAQLPAVVAGGTFNILSDSLAWAFNSDSAGTRVWFLRPTLSVVPLTTGNWTSFGAGCTTNIGSNYINVIGSLGTTPNICGWQHSVSAGNFAYTFVLYCTVPDVTPANCQMGFTDATKTEGIGPEADGSKLYSIDVVKSTALSSGTYSTANGAAASGWGPPAANGTPIVIKLSRTGTTLTGAMSVNGGLTFDYVGFNDTVPFMTATAIYIAVDPRTSSGTAVAGTATLVSSTLQ